MHSLDDFDYKLPEHLIAQYPRENRGQDKLMVVNKSKISHHQFQDFYSFLNKNDVVVINNTKVINARLTAKKSTGGRVEVFVDKVLADGRARVFLKSSKRCKVGDTLTVGNDTTLTIIDKAEQMFYLTSEVDWQQLCDQQGKIPLPPYVKRDANTIIDSRYQTVYATHLDATHLDATHLDATHQGSVAAPTAGLHFDENFRQQIAAKNAKTAELTLEIGSGTFAPIRQQNYLEHKMHKERFHIDSANCDVINDCRSKGGRVIATGTTTLRALESMQSDNKLEPTTTATDIFIYPGFKFKVVDVLLTNFHLPKSSLMLLVAAFAGKDTIFNGYQQAIEHNYRFFSYGDAMLLTTKTGV